MQITYGCICVTTEERRKHQEVPVRMSSADRNTLAAFKSRLRLPNVLRIK
jgi:hypothetical protein